MSNSVVVIREQVVRHVVVSSGPQGPPGQAGPAGAIVGNVDGGRPEEESIPLGLIDGGTP